MSVTERIIFTDDDSHALTFEAEVDENGEVTVFFGAAEVTQQFREMLGQTYLNRIQLRNAITKASDEDYAYESQRDLKLEEAI